MAFQRNYFNGSIVSAVLLLLVSFFLVEYFTGIKVSEGGNASPVQNFYLPEFPVMALVSLFIFYVLLNMDAERFIKSEKLKEFISWLSRESYGVYLAHMMYVEVVKMFFKSQPHLSPAISIPVGVFMVLVLSYITIYVMKKLFSLIRLEKLIA